MEEGKIQMKNKKLIINADDFGMTQGVTQGIIEAHKQGLVTSTTALTVSDAFLPSMETVHQQAPSLAIGVHLTLTLNKHKPVLPREVVPSLVDENGYFWSQKEYLEKVNLEEVYIEWEAQILQFLKSGHQPTHIDSHHNVHGGSEGLVGVALKLARKFKLPIRNSIRKPEDSALVDNYNQTPTTDQMIGDFYDQNVSMEQLIQIFDAVQESDLETFEMNCHPAFVDADLMETSSYNMRRIEELKILTSQKAKEELSKRNILLTNYQML